MLAIPYHPIQNLLFESRRWFKWSMFCCNCYLFEVMGLYWSCDWFATFSTLRVQGAFLWGDGWWLEMIWWTKRWVGWDFCSINLNQPGNDNFSISLILTPTRIGGGYLPVSQWLDAVFDAVSTCQRFTHDSPRVRWLWGFIPTVPSQIRFGMQMLA